MGVAETNPAGEAAAERVQTTVWPQLLTKKLLKRQVVNMYWGEGQQRGVCWGGCGELMVYGDVQLAHWRLKGELNEGNGFAGTTAQVSCISTYCFHSKQVLTTACLLSALAHLPPQFMGAVMLPSCACCNQGSYLQSRKPLESHFCFLVSAF